MLLAPVSAIWSALIGRWILAGAAFGLAVTTLAVEARLYLRSGSNPTAGVALRILSGNLREGKADPGGLVKVGGQADIVALQELTPELVDRLTAAGLDAAFPYRWLDARDGPYGVGVWSRFPMHSARRVDGYVMGFLSAQLQVPGVSSDLTVVVVHLPGPWPQRVDDWRNELRRLPHSLLAEADFAAGGPVVVASDLNSTTDMRPFRALLRGGFLDAAEQCGAGIVPTFPAGRRIPPFLAIDHILTCRCTATSLRSIALPGSDHRALVATVQIPG